jgi:hypothetical protein
MTITTEEAERLAQRLANDAEAPQTARYQPYTDHAMINAAAALRSLAAERDALQAEVERLKAGGCARDQGTTQFCAEAAALQAKAFRVAVAYDALKAENARLREAIEMARECIDDKDVIGARLTLGKSLGETQ